MPNNKKNAPQIFFEITKYKGKFKKTLQEGGGEQVQEEGHEQGRHPPGVFFFIVKNMHN